MSIPHMPASAFFASHGRTATVNLSSVDLNLLVALEALLEHCNVTQAANTVGLSQPAMSRALSRLRGMFDDDLLVRTSAGFVRTIRGEQLYNRLPVTLDAVREIILSRTAGSGDWLPMIRLAMPDHQALLILPHLLSEFDSRPARPDIVTEPLCQNMLKRLENGELELVVGQVDCIWAGFHQRMLYADGYACLLRRGHSAQDGWSAERFCELRHAVIVADQDVERSQLAEFLATLPARQCCAVSPNTMGAALAVLESDMVLTVPRRVAVKMAALLPLEMVELPIRIEPYEVRLLWHERSQGNVEHDLVRSRIVSAVQGGASSSGA